MHRFFVAPDILAPISTVLPPKVTAGDAGTGSVIEAVPEEQFCISLPEKITHQVKDVLHLGMGEQLVLLDNSGDEFVVGIVKSGRARVEVQVLERRRGQSESPVRIVLCQGLLKSARFEWILEKGTELGVAVFAPMLCRRSMAGLEEAGAAKIQRWQRIIQEAAEQCGRARMPELLPIRPLMHALNDIPRGALAFMPWEEEHSRSLREGLEVGASSMAGRESPLEPVTVVLFIGPEGGLMAEEVLLARRHGVQVVTLGQRILRAETAALATVANVMYALGG
jgi:16S rRNA (uracil1498-N3)-methyltransferase